MQHRRICSPMCTSRSASWSPEVVKWKLETNTFSIDAPQAHNFAHLCAVLPVNLSSGLPYKSLPLKVFFLKNFNQTLALFLIGLENLIKHQRSWPLFNFHANKLLNAYLFCLFDLALQRVLPEYSN